ncbi:MAG: DUF896 domain-containing protein [Bacillota bacterium]|jgi:uncharacterized protein YnzC (UPF0291/DUF896 family)
MLSKEQLARIGELSRKQRSDGLTVAEQAEQHALRQAYLEAFRKSFRSQLEASGLVATEGAGECRCKDPNCGHHPNLPH